MAGRCCPCCGSNRVRISSVMNFFKYRYEYLFECECGACKEGFINMEDIVTGYTNLNDLILMEVKSDNS